jgi:hypothetical protein
LNTSTSPGRRISGRSSTPRSDRTVPSTSNRRAASRGRAGRRAMRSTEARSRKGRRALLRLWRRRLLRGRVCRGGRRRRLFGRGRGSSLCWRRCMLCRGRHNRCSLRCGRCGHNRRRKRSADGRPDDLGRLRRRLADRNAVNRGPCLRSPARKHYICGRA